MNILFLAHRIPYPPDKGDKIRSFYEIKYLSKRYNIYLGTTLDHKSEEVHIGELRKYCKEVFAIHFSRRKRLLTSFASNKAFSVANFYDKKLQSYVDRTLREKKIDAVVCFCSSMAEYIFKNPLFREKKLDGTVLIMDYVDLDSDKWLQYARYAKFPLNLIYRIENKRLFKYEIKINKLFHHSIFVSKREVSVFRKQYAHTRKIHVIPNGVDYEYFSALDINMIPEPAIRNSHPILVFTGVMDYFANEDGVKWFCDNIFPRIREEFSQARFFVVGNRPSNLVWSLTENDGVTVTGYVADIRPYYRLADVCVMPLRIARGLQNKVLEAMATANAVVATSNAADGIIHHNNVDIVIADEGEKFAREVIGLLKEKKRRQAISRKARENIRRNYSWEENLKAFDKLLQPSQ